MAYTQQGSKLIGTGYVGNPAQGWSASLSDDGNTLAVGGLQDDSSIGAVWIFTRSGSTWTQQGSKLVGTGAIGIASQGFSVALSGDGNTLAIGGPTDDSINPGAFIGAVWIFTRSGSTWTQQGSKLVGTGYVAGTLGVAQGYSVALSNDGNTLAAGGYNDDSGRGATWVWTRSGGVWTQQGSKLVGTGYTVPGSSWQGVSVSLSSDGNTLAIGGPLDNTSIGATWIFTRSGGVWTQQGSKLVGTGYTPGPFGPGTPFQGQSVSLSGDSDSLAVGGPQDNDGIGATWVWTRSGGVWTQQGSKLVGTGYVGTPTQGWDISLIGTGDTLAVGGRFDDPTDPLDAQTAIGATWIFTRSGGVWTQQGSKLVGTGGVSSAGVLQGSSVSLSSDSSTLAVGGPGDGSGIGATWIFAGSAATTTTTTAGPGTTTTTTAAPSPTILYTLTNTGTEGLTIQSMTFNDPPNIGHIANLVNLGGSSTETGNASLSYNFPVSATQTFTLGYTNAGASPGTYNGNVIIGGSNGTSKTIASTITVNGGAPGTTTTTTAAPGTTTTTTSSGTAGFTGSPYSAPYYYENSTGADPPIASVSLNLTFTNQGVVSILDTTGDPGIAVSNLPIQWFTPTGGGIGGSYDIRVLSMSGTCTGGSRANYYVFSAGPIVTDPNSYPTPTSWISLSSSQTLTVAIGSAPIVGCGTNITFTVEIAPSGDHSSPITGVFTLNIGTS